MNYFDGLTAKEECDHAGQRCERNRDGFYRVENVSPAASYHEGRLFEAARPPNHVKTAIVSRRYNVL